MTACACGCGRTFESRALVTGEAMGIYYSTACRVRAYRARRKAAELQHVP